MLKQLYELAKQLLSLARDTQENKAQIRELQDQVEELTAAVQWIAYELRRVDENNAHEREKLGLRLENALLRFERRLSSERSGSGEEGDARGERSA